jgi:hypothetical protein
LMKRELDPPNESGESPRARQFLAPIGMFSLC